MIGVDTNIIVRLLARDDEAQFARSVALVERTPREGPLLINPIVLAEAVWVLERVYGIAAGEARARLRELAGSAEFTVPDALMTADWEHWFSEKHADFFDVVIAASNRASGCSRTYTFDRRAAKSVPGMELLT